MPAVTRQSTPAPLSSPYPIGGRKADDSTRPDTGAGGLNRLASSKNSVPPRNTLRALFNSVQSTDPGAAPQAAARAVAPPASPPPASTGTPGPSDRHLLDNFATAFPQQRAQVEAEFAQEMQKTVAILRRIPDLSAQELEYFDEMDASLAAHAAAAARGDVPADGQAHLKRIEHMIAEHMARTAYWLQQRPEAPDSTRERCGKMLDELLPMIEGDDAYVPPSATPVTTHPVASTFTPPVFPVFPKRPAATDLGTFQTPLPPAPPPPPTPDPTQFIDALRQIDRLQQELKTAGPTLSKTEREDLEYQVHLGKLCLHLRQTLNPQSEDFGNALKADARKALDRMGRASDDAAVEALLAAGFERLFNGTAAASGKPASTPGPQDPASHGLDRPEATRRLAGFDGFLEDNAQRTLAEMAVVLADRVDVVSARLARMNSDPFAGTAQERAAYGLAERVGRELCDALKRGNTDYAALRNAMLSFVAAERNLNGVPAMESALDAAMKILMSAAPNAGAKLKRNARTPDVKGKTPRRPQNTPPPIDTGTQPKRVKFASPLQMSPTSGLTSPPIRFTRVIDTPPPSPSDTGTLDKPLHKTPRLFAGAYEKLKAWQARAQAKLQDDKGKPQNDSPQIRDNAADANATAVSAPPPPPSRVVASAASVASSESSNDLHVLDDERRSTVIELQAGVSRLQRRLDQDLSGDQPLPAGERWQLEFARDFGREFIRATFHADGNDAVVQQLFDFALERLQRDNAPADDDAVKAAVVHAYEMLKEDDRPPSPSRRGSVSSDTSSRASEDDAFVPIEDPPSPTSFKRRASILSDSSSEDNVTPLQDPPSPILTSWRRESISSDSLSEDNFNPLEDSRPPFSAFTRRESMSSTSSSESRHPEATQDTARTQRPETLNDEQQSVAGELDAGIAELRAQRAALSDGAPSASTPDNRLTMHIELATHLSALMRNPETHPDSIPRAAGYGRARLLAHPDPRVQQALGGVYEKLANLPAPVVAKESQTPANASRREPMEDPDPEPAAPRPARTAQAAASPLEAMALEPLQSQGLGGGPDTSAAAPVLTDQLLGQAQLLGLDIARLTNAARDDGVDQLISQLFRQQALQVHPDKKGGATVDFQKLNAAKTDLTAFVEALRTATKATASDGNGGGLAAPQRAQLMDSPVMDIPRGPADAATRDDERA